MSTVSPPAGIGLADPCEHFAERGLEVLIARVGSWGGSDSREEFDEEEGDYVIVWPDADEIDVSRREDHQRVIDLMIEAKAPAAQGNRDGVYWLGYSITWPDRVPALKTWAGQQTLAKLIRERQKALKIARPEPAMHHFPPYRPQAVEELFSLCATIRGSSGFDRRSAPTSIELGFSPTHHPILSRVAVELLAVIGLEFAPIISVDREHVGFISHRSVWSFRIEKRGDYYGRWGLAQRDRRLPALRRPFDE